MVKYLLFIMRKNYLQMIRVFKIREKMIRVVSKLEKFYLVNLVNAFFIVNFIFIDIYSNDLYLLYKIVLNNLYYYIKINMLHITPLICI